MGEVELGIGKHDKAGRAARFRFRDQRPMFFHDVNNIQAQRLPFLKCTSHDTVFSAFTMELVKHHVLLKIAK